MTGTISVDPRSLIMMRSTPLLSETT
jgi:hypothetical protein